MPDSVHPTIREATNALNDPEVQDLVKRLSARGLAVAVPHMHGADGELVPLPPDRVAYEDDQRVTFPHVADPVLDEAEPVMWGWDAAAQRPTPLAHCRGKFHH